MRTLTLALFLLMASALTASAQRYNGHGYFFYGLDAPNSGNLAQLMSTGGGGEYFLYKGLAAGAELTYLFPRTEPANGIGLASFNGAWHFVNRNHPRAFVPFVTAGYSLGFRGETAGFFNFGGGATWWFAHHAGLRTEVRFYEFVRGYPDHFDTSLRFGIQIR